MEPAARFARKSKPHRNISKSCWHPESFRYQITETVPDSTTHLHSIVLNIPKPTYFPSREMRNLLRLSLQEPVNISQWPETREIVGIERDMSIEGLYLPAISCSILTLRHHPPSSLDQNRSQSPKSSHPQFTKTIRFCNVFSRFSWFLNIIEFIMFLLCSVMYI